MEHLLHVDVTRGAEWKKVEYGKTTGAHDTRNVCHTFLKRSKFLQI